MVKIQPLELPPPPTKLDFLEYLDQYNGWTDYGFSMDYLYDYHYYFLHYNLEWFQSQAVPDSVFEEHFGGDWRKGQEIRKIVITQTLYQISPNSTQA